MRSDAASVLEKLAMVAIILACALLVILIITGRPPSGETRCAEDLGIEWSLEDGATERLDEFHACVCGH